MCLTIGVTILASTKIIQLVLSSKCTVGAPVWSAKASIYLRITLFLLTYLYMNLIPQSVESEAIAFWICNLHQTETQIRVWRITETDRLLMRIIAYSASWWHSKQFWFVYSSAWLPLDVILMKFDPL